MNKFETLGINGNAIKAIEELGFETPTPIQDRVIPVLIEGAKDMVALAQTGTGKTAAFGLPLITTLDFNSRNTQALILSPTRELCMQITSDLQNFAKYTPGANIVAVYGGASISGQLHDIKNGTQIIVATPGRMLDIINRKKVDFSKVKVVVLDEADKMLDMGFQEDLDAILSVTPKEKNTWLFSATMPDEVLRISRKYMNRPVEITVGERNLANENIEHIYYVVNHRDSYAALKRIVDYHPDIFGLIFCRTKIETQRVADALIKDGYNADALHGDLSQAQRDFVMKRFRSHVLQMLVATDVAARGIDVSDITHVINYNLPDEIDNYTHRSGRTARAGKTGISITLIGPREVSSVRTLERMTKKKFIQSKLPNGYEICERQLFNLIQGIHNAKVDEKGIESYLPKIFEELKDLSKEEIIKRFVSTEFNRFLDYYKNAPDINSVNSGNEERKDIVRFFLSIGEMDRLDAAGLKEFLCSLTGLDAASIPRVDIKKSFSFVDVKSEAVETFTNAMKDQTCNGRPVKVEASGAREGGFNRNKKRSGFNGKSRSDRGRSGRQNSYSGKPNYNSGGDYPAGSSRFIPGSGHRDGGNKRDSDRRGRGGYGGHRDEEGFRKEGGGNRDRKKRQYQD